MGICKYCGTAAGLFRNEHPECLRNASKKKASALASIKAVMYRAVSDRKISNEVTAIYSSAKTPAEIESPTLTALLSSLQNELNCLIKDAENDKQAIFAAILSGWSEAALQRTRTQPPLTLAEREGIAHVIEALDLPKSFAGIYLTTSGVNINGHYRRALPANEMGVLSAVAVSEGAMAIDFSSLVWMVRNEEYTNAHLLSGQCPFILKDKNELAVWVSRCELMQEVTISEYAGTHHGASVRVAPGLWWRTGEVRGHKEIHSSIKALDEIGDFAITTHAVYFGGKRCNFRIPFSRVIKINSYKDSVGLCKDGGKEQIFLTLTDGLAYYVYNLLEEIMDRHKQHHNVADSKVHTFKLDI